MAGVFDSLANLSKSVAGKLQSAGESAAGPLAATSHLTSAIENAAQRIESPETEQKIEQAVKAGETYLALTLGFQALASFAAVGLFIVSVKNMHMAQERAMRRRPRRCKKGSR